jgi:hypothetical protein
MSGRLTCVSDKCSSLVNWVLGLCSRCSKEVLQEVNMNSALVDGTIGALLKQRHACGTPLHLANAAGEHDCF